VTFCDDVSSKASWPFVRTMVEREVVLSTNDVAAEILRSGGVALPLAVWAHRQTRGRGRGNHEWWSDDGSLTFTIAIDPPAHGLGQIVLPRVALATAVAVIDALVERGFGGLGLGIRWPNDLECGGRKLGGILPEGVELAEGERLLIGVGLNVQTNLEDAPAEVRAMATSLEAALPGTNAKDLRAGLLASILRRFELVLGKLASADPALAGRWNDLDVLRDRRVRVDVGTHVVEGRGGGIDADGALCVDDGRTTVRFFGGTVLRSRWSRKTISAPWRWAEYAGRAARSRSGGLGLLSTRR
jgi:BirA family transcriptional regulator, biotin operon repressor / biotin---[acetyl-CoA-carboxylase] ligase